MTTKKKFKAVCRHCGLVIWWNETHREWDRVTPNKTFEDNRDQFNTCVTSSGLGRHDPRT